MNKIKKDVQEYFLKLQTEYQNNKKLVHGGLFVAAGLSLSLIVFAQIVKKAKEDPIDEPALEALEENIRPEDYLDPLGRWPKPVIQKVIIKEEKPQQKRLKPEDIFKPLPPKKDDDQYGELRAQIEHKRRFSLDVAYIPQDKQGFDFDHKKIWQDLSFDTDYAGQGLNKNIPSYPVDLSRTLTVDNIIPAVLITEINSELSSDKVLAQIEQDVYASHGRKILIPRGSKAIGRYEPLDQNGDKRLQLTWYRILSPEGVNIILNAEGLDSYGQAGITGTVDNRFGDKYGNALLFASISALAQLSVDVESEAQVNAADTFSSEFGSVTADLIRENFDIVPKVNIPRGARINISPLTDLWFKEANKGEIEVVPMPDLQNANFKYGGFQYETNQ